MHVKGILSLPMFTSIIKHLCKRLTMQTACKCTLPKNVEAQLLVLKECEHYVKGGHDPSNTRRWPKVQFTIESKYNKNRTHTQRFTFTSSFRKIKGEYQIQLLVMWIICSGEKLINRLLGGNSANFVDSILSFSLLFLTPAAVMMSNECVNDGIPPPLSLPTLSSTHRNRHHYRRMILFLHMEMERMADIQKEISFYWLQNLQNKIAVVEMIRYH